MDPTIGFKLAYLVFCCTLVVGGGHALLWPVLLRRRPGSSATDAMLAFGGAVVVMGAASPFLALGGAVLSIVTVDLCWELGLWARWVVVIGASVPLVAGAVWLVYCVFRG